MMELIIDVVLAVMVSFLAFYLTKRLRMTDEHMQRELQRDLRHEQPLIKIMDKLHEFDSPESRSRLYFSILLLYLAQI